MLYYHGSINELPIGLELTPNKEGYVQSNELENFLEKHRPENGLSRFESVFLCANPEDIDYCGGFTDFIYEVELNETPQASDLAWYSLAQSLLETDKIEEAIVAAQNYWSGKQFHIGIQSVFEYRVKKAKIVEEFLD